MPAHAHQRIKTITIKSKNPKRTVQISQIKSTVIKYDNETDKTTSITTFKYSLKITPIPKEIKYKE